MRWSVAYNIQNTLDTASTVTKRSCSLCVFILYAVLDITPLYSTTCYATTMGVAKGAIGPVADPDQAFGGRQNVFTCLIPTVVCDNRCVSHKRGYLL